MSLRPLFSSCFKPLAVALLAATAFTGSAYADVTIKHAQGETRFAQTPQKIVVFDLNVLDTLKALNVDVTGVPGGALHGDLSSFQDERYSKVGTVFEPDYEAVNALKPDLIIIGGRSAPKYAELAKIAPTIDLTVDRTNFVTSAVSHIESLGELFGKKEQADARIAGLKTDIAKLHTAAQDAGTGLVIITTGGRMSAHGPGSRFDIMYSDFGVKPAATDLKTGNHGESISPEFISKTNPDWLFVVDRDAAIGRKGQPAAQLLDTPLLAKANAFANNQVIYLDAPSWYLSGGGLTSMEKIVAQLNDAFAKN